LADDVRQRLADWRAEQARLADGQVKYHGRWFWPAGKADAIAADRARAAQEARQQETAELHRRLTRRQAEHDNLARGLAEAEASLQRSQYALDALLDIVIPIVEDRLVTVPLPGSAVYFQPLEYRRMVVDEKVVSHPDRAAYEARVVFYQRQVATAKQQQADLKQELAAIRDRLAMLETSAMVTGPADGK
jgi:cell division protein FtsB